MIKFAKAVHFLVKQESHEVILIKVLVMVTMLSAIFLPVEHSIWVSTMSNLIWLWRI